MFFKGSRYEKVAEHEGEDRHGRAVRYKGIREIPPTPARLGHEVAQGERLDHIAHRYFRDAERFWRIADANLAIWPDDLLDAGKAARRSSPGHGDHLPEEVLEPREVIAVPPSRGEPRR